MSRETLEPISLLLPTALRTLAADGPTINCAFVLLVLLIFCQLRCQRAATALAFADKFGGLNPQALVSESGGCGCRIPARRGRSPPVCRRVPTTRLPLEGRPRSLRRWARSACSRCGRCRGSTEN